MDMRTVLARAIAELTDAEARLRFAQDRVDELRAIRDGLQLALDRYGAGDGDEGAATERESVTAVKADDSAGATVILGSDAPESSGAEPPSHTEISYNALQGIGKAASTDEVHNKAVAAGHRLNREQVRNALTYLRRTERIVRVAPGTWAIRAEATPQNDFAPAASAAGASRAGENGSTQGSALARAGLPYTQ